MTSLRDDAATLTTLDRRRVRLPSLGVVAETASGEVACALGLAPIIVGTSPECDLVVADVGVSRHHCSLSLTLEGVLIKDLRSKNGTAVGGVAVREAYLTTNGFARIGSVTLRLRVAGSPAEVKLWPGARFGDVLGGSVVMRALFEQLHQAASSSQPLVLVGEAGTGKEILARAVHDSSERREGPFVVVDVGATSPTMFDSELFGHVRGAFTGASTDRTGLLAEADGGTLFLDEVADLPLELQPRLLRALEARQFRPVGSNAWRSFDARVIVATRTDLRAAVAAGAFREDLLYRLAVLQARVPPLRERKEDIEILVEHLLAAESPPRTLFDLPPDALALLNSHDWPGNVRELKNTVARLVVFPESLDLAIDRQGAEGAAHGSFDALVAMPWREARELLVDRFEASYLKVKLREHGGNVAATATSMGISRQMVSRLMVRHGLRSGSDDNA